MRKLFASIAAAATMLGGMAFGIADAMAADGDQTITIHNSQSGHIYKAYQIATFSNKQSTEQDGKKTAFVDVNTVAGMEKAVYLAAAAAKNVASLPTEYGVVVGTGAAADYSATNPAAYVATFDAQTLRKFANELDKYLTADTQYTVNGSEPSGSDVTLSMPEGWYAVKDTKGAQPIEGSTAIVSTTVAGADGLTIASPYEEGQQNITKPGQVNAKSEDKPTGDKTSDKDATAVGVGEPIRYTLTSYVPTNYYEANTAYNMTFKDVPGTGLTVSRSEADFKVNGTKIGAQAGQVAAAIGGELALEGSSFDGDGAKFFTVSLDKDAIKTALGNNPEVAANGYYKLEFTYTAKVNDAAGGVLENTYHEGDIAHTNEVKTGSFAFQKIGVGDDKTGLNGAEFKIYQADTTGNKTGSPLWFTGADGTYKLSATQEAATGNTQTLTTATVGATKGKLIANGLAAGTYVVEETKAPIGYAGNLMVTFNVTIKTDGTAELVQDAKHQVDPVKGTVLNVKSITQLPLTGAAGTVLFAVIGVLLVGAAVMVLIKSRSVKHQLGE